MKDIAYYAGFLSTENQEKINSAHHDQLVEVLTEVATDLYAATEFGSRGFAYEPEEGDITPLALDRIMDATERDKLALIRGLCDRIELKLMEAAK